MIMMMLGFCCCATAGTQATVAAKNDAAKPGKILLTVVLLTTLTSVGWSKLKQTIHSFSDPLSGKQLRLVPYGRVCD
jgi:hypothetical protein